jgi:hypothetical protein
MDSTIINKTIHGYLVELELDPAVEWTDCWIMKDGFGSSLEFLETHGELLHDTIGESLEVSPYTIKAIRKWAEKNGY